MKKRSKRNGKIGRRLCRVLAAVLLGIVFLCGCSPRTEELSLEPFEAGETEPEKAPEPSRMLAQAEAEPSPEAGLLTKETEGGECYVHVCGAVKSPGVYRLPAGSRVYEAIRQSGGFTEEACQDYVNQAMAVADGQRLFIPTKEEAEEGRIPEAEDLDTSTGLVNINTADLERLCSLNGIGESRAGAIIAYREKNGNFSKPEDLMKVTGIKESSYEKIKDSICVK